MPSSDIVEQLREAQSSGLAQNHAAEAANEIESLRQRLRDIGDYAHEHSTGPAVPDALWTVREMAYELV